MHAKSLGDLALAIREFYILCHGTCSNYLDKGCGRITGVVRCGAVEVKELSVWDRIIGGLIDSLWFWLFLALVIMFVYASWALIETVVMHTPRAPPTPF